MAEINWGILDPNTPYKAATSYQDAIKARDDREAANQLRAMQMQDMTMRNRMAEMQMQDAATERENKNALNRAYAEAYGSKGIDYDKAIGQLAQGGRGAMVPGIMKERDAQRKAQMERASEGVKLLKSLTGRVLASPTTDDALGALQEFQQYSGQDMQAEAQKVLAFADDPEKIRQWAASHAIEADKLLPKFDSMNLGGGVLRQGYDPLTGKSIGSGEYAPMRPLPADVAAQQERKARAGAANVSVNTGQKGFDNEIKLRDNFTQEPIYKAYQEMKSAYGQIKQSLAKASPAGDLAGATKIMKLLDPGSVVRESELGMAMAASGALDRLENYAGMIVNGTKLTPKQRKDFQGLADALYGESVKQYDSKREEYVRLGGEYGLNAERALGKPVASRTENPAQMSGADKQALDWANSNPGDPRAAEIKRRLGVK